MVNHVCDSVLIDRYKSGNTYSFETLFLRHKQRIFNYINSKIIDIDVSNDILQETFIKVFNLVKIGKYNEQGKFVSWVMRIAHNLVIDHFRKNNRIPTLENNDEYDVFQFISDSSPNAEDVLASDQIVKDLQKLVQELPDDQKEVLIMRLYRDMSFKEIAKNTNVSINTALGRMRYAIINLRKLVVEHQIVLEA